MPKRGCIDERADDGRAPKTRPTAVVAFAIRACSRHALGSRTHFRMNNIRIGNNCTSCALLQSQCIQSLPLCILCVNMRLATPDSRVANMLLLHGLRLLVLRTWGKNITRPSHVLFIFARRLRKAPCQKSRVSLSFIVVARLSAILLHHTAR